MSKKFNYLYTILHYYHQEFLKLLYENRKVSNNIDNNWKNIKLSHSVYPNNMSKELKGAYDYNARFNNSKKGEMPGAFKFLNKEYQGLIMKRFKD